MAVILAIIFGCGSSSSSPGSAAETAGTAQKAADGAALTRFVERGDELCRVGDAAIRPINERGAEIQRRHRGSGDEAVLLAPVLREGLRIYRRYLRRFERIPPPPREIAQVNAILAGLRKVGEDIERLAGAVVRGELAQVRAITSEREVDHARVSAQELELGLKICGQPPAQPSVSG